MCESIIANCPLTDNPVLKACHSYTAPVWDKNGSKDVYYKNIHCAYCNGKTDINNPSCKQSSGSNINGAQGDSRAQGATGSGGGSVPLTVLFDFSSGTLEHSGIRGAPPEPLNCPERFTYVRSSHQCRRVSCPPASFLNHYQTCTFSTDYYQVNHTVGNELDPLYRKTVVELARKDDNVSDDQILSILSGLWSYYSSVDHYSIMRYNRRYNATEEVRLDWGEKGWVRSENVGIEEDCLKDFNFGFIVSLQGQARHWHKNIESGANSIGYWFKRKPSCNLKCNIDFVLIQVKYSNFAHTSYLCNSSFLIPKSCGERSFIRIDVMGISKIQIDFLHNETFNSTKVAQEVIFTVGQMYVSQNSREEGNWSRTERVYLCKELPLCSLNYCQKSTNGNLTTKIRRRLSY